MLQLVKKDFYIHKMLWLLAILVIGIYILSQVSPLFIGIIFCMTMPIQLLSTDEKKAAQLFLNSLPFTRKDIVNSKYMTALLFITSIIVTISVLQFLINQKLPNYYDLLMIAIISLTVVAIFYPFAYRFSTKYFTFLFAGIFAIYLLTIRLFIPNLNDQIRNISGQLVNENYIILYMYLLFGAIVLYALSWLLSVRIYSKKVIE